MEVNGTNPLTFANTFERFVTPLTFTEGWNMFGCYYDPINNNNHIPAIPDPILGPFPSVIPNTCYNVMYDGTTSTSANISHTGDFIDADDLVI